MLTWTVLVKPATVLMTLLVVASLAACTNGLGASSARSGRDQATRGPAQTAVSIAATAPSPEASGGGRADPVGNNCPAGFLVKGTVSPTGERLYYDVGRTGYDKAQPVDCFVAGSVARAAGYRDSKR